MAFRRITLQKIEAKWGDFEGEYWKIAFCPKFFLQSIVNHKF